MLYTIVAFLALHSTHLAYKKHYVLQEFEKDTKKWHHEKREVKLTTPVQVRSL